LANKAKQELWRERIKSFQASGLSRKECAKSMIYREPVGVLAAQASTQRN